MVPCRSVVSRGTGAGPRCERCDFAVLDPGRFGGHHGAVTTPPPSDGSAERGRAIFERLRAHAAEVDDPSTSGTSPPPPAAGTTGRKHAHETIGAEPAPSGGAAGPWSTPWPSREVQEPSAPAAAGPASRDDRVGAESAESAAGRGDPRAAAAPVGRPGSFGTEVRPPTVDGRPPPPPSSSSWRSPKLGSMRGG